MPVPRAESPSLRGLAAAASIAAAPGVATAGDDYLNYNMTGGSARCSEATCYPCLQGLSMSVQCHAASMIGEFTPFMVIGYFGLTTFLTAFAFGSYLVLTKLKII